MVERNNIIANALEKGIIDELDIITIHDLLDTSGYKLNNEIDIILTAMFAGMNTGDLCLKLTAENIEYMFHSYGINVDRHAIERAVKNVKTGKYQALIAPSGETDFFPLILSDKGEDLYFQKYHASKERLDRNLRDIINSTSKSPDHDTIRKSIKEIYAIDKTKPELIDPGNVFDQKLAVVLAMIQNFLIISGGPGSGKTHLIFNILRCLLAMDYSSERIMLTAPTGRAAKRMSDAIAMSYGKLAQVNPADEMLRDIRPQTLHRLLRYSPARNDFTYNADNLLPADVVIVDEVSMADVVMMSCLVEALPKSAKLILLGDPDQLPSVEAGAILSRFVNGSCTTKISSRMAQDIRQYFHEIEFQYLDKITKHVSSEEPLNSMDHMVFLSGSRRSSKNILEVARRINDKDTSVVSSFIPLTAGSIMEKESALDKTKELSGVYHIKSIATEQIYRTSDYISDPNLVNMLKDYLHANILGGNNKEQKVWMDIIGEQFDANVPGDSKVGEFYSMINRSRILTLTRTGDCGCIAINGYLQRFVYHELARKSGACIERTAVVYAGMPIIITQNDYQRELFNGDVGVVLRGNDGGLRAYFPVRDTFASYPISQLPHYETAYAVTVHKSQGSEYDMVLLIMPPEKECPLLTKEVLYTAVTRARNAAIIYGSVEIIKHAISAEMNRYSGPGFWNDHRQD